MEKLSALALLITLVGGVHDLLTKRIPNWLTLPSIVIGIALQFYTSGFAGAMDALLAIGLAFILYFPIHAVGKMGAGDVKLLMAGGAFLGWKGTLFVAIVAILIGAFYALVEIAFRKRLWAVVSTTYSFMRSVMVPGLVVEKLKIDESRKFAFGICISLAVALWIYRMNLGGNFL